MITEIFDKLNAYDVTTDEIQSIHRPRKRKCTNAKQEIDSISKFQKSNKKSCKSNQTFANSKVSLKNFDSLLTDLPHEILQTHIFSKLDVPDYFAVADAFCFKSTISQELLAKLHTTQEGRNRIEKWIRSTSPAQIITSLDSLRKQHEACSIKSKFLANTMFPLIGGIIMDILFCQTTSINELDDCIWHKGMKIIQNSISLFISRLDATIITWSIDQEFHDLCNQKFQFLPELVDPDDILFDFDIIENCCGELGAHFRSDAEMHSSKMRLSALSAFTKVAIDDITAKRDVIIKEYEDEVLMFYNPDKYFDCRRFRENVNYDGVFEGETFGLEINESPEFWEHFDLTEWKILEDVEVFQEDGGTGSIFLIDVMDFTPWSKPLKIITYSVDSLEDRLFNSKFNFHADAVYNQPLNPLILTVG